MVAAANLDQETRLFLEPTKSSSLATRTMLLQKGAKASTSISPDISGLLLHWTPLQLRWLITKPRRSDPRNTTSITMPREINAQDKLLAAGAIEETW
jgi:hypothetical protein